MRVTQQNGSGNRIELTIKSDCKRFMMEAYVRKDTMMLSVKGKRDYVEKFVNTFNLLGKAEIMKQLSGDDVFFNVWRLAMTCKKEEGVDKLVKLFYKFEKDL